MQKLIKSMLFWFLTYLGMMWRTKSHCLERCLYLTFDDGPNPDFTKEVLDILREYNAKATFFLVGSSCNQYMDIVSRIVEEGHAVGNHGYDHISLKNTSWTTIKKQIEKTDAVLDRIVKKDKFYIRPPRGEWGLKYLIYTVTRFRRTVFWSIDPKDFKCENSDQVLSGIDYDSLRGGEIILLHDKSTVTVDAIKKMVPELLRRGYKLEALEV